MEGTVHEGMQTPWGKADSAEMLCYGIGTVGTPSHGGIKVDRKHNSLIPEYMRNSGGWYEEDCDWAIPFCVFEVELLAGGDKWACKVITKGQHAESLKTWHTAEFNRFYGQHVEDKYKTAEDAQAKAVADGLPVIKAGVCLPNDNVFAWTTAGNYEVDRDVYHNGLKRLDKVLDIKGATRWAVESPREITAQKRKAVTG